MNIALSNTKTLRFLDNVVPQRQYGAGVKPFTQQSGQTRNSIGQNRTQSRRSRSLRIHLGFGDCPFFSKKKPSACAEGFFISRGLLLEAGRLEIVTAEFEER